MGRILFSAALAALFALNAYAVQDGWLVVPIRHQDFELFYQPLSIQARGHDTREVTSVINYTSKAGTPESLIGSTLYNCKEQSKQELGTSQHQKHWGDGELIAKSPSETLWRNVIPGSVGASLMVVVCADTQAISPQLER